MWVENLPQLYKPQENVIVDKQLVAFRSHCPFKQFIPSKPAKYDQNLDSLLLWKCYTWNVNLYTEKEEGASKKSDDLEQLLLERTIRKNKPDLSQRMTNNTVESSCFFFTNDTFHYENKDYERNDQKLEIILD